MHGPGSWPTLICKHELRGVVSTSSTLSLVRSAVYINPHTFWTRRIFKLSKTQLGTVKEIVMTVCFRNTHQAAVNCLPLAYCANGNRSQIRRNFCELLPFWKSPMLLSTGSIEEADYTDDDDVIHPGVVDHQQGQHWGGGLYWRWLCDPAWDCCHSGFNSSPHHRNLMHVQCPRSCCTVLALAGPNLFWRMW